MYVFWTWLVEVAVMKLAETSVSLRKRATATTTGVDLHLCGTCQLEGCWIHLARKKGYADELQTNK